MVGKKKLKKFIKFTRKVLFFIWVAGQEIKLGVQGHITTFEVHMAGGSKKGKKMCPNRLTMEKTEQNLHVRSVFYVGWQG